MYSLNAGYGQVVGQFPFKGAGKVFVVGDVSGPRRALAQQLFRVDPDGEVRFFSTIAAAVEVARANSGDVIYVMPGHPEVIVPSTKAGVSIINLDTGAYFGPHPELSGYNLERRSSTLGATGATTLFTVTGEVEVVVIGHVITAGAGATSTIEVGVAGATAGLIPQTPTPNLAINTIWVDATPSVLETKPTPRIIANSLPIIQTIGTAAATAGVVLYYCYWLPISGNGRVVAA